MTIAGFRLEPQAALAQLRGGSEAILEWNEWRRNPNHVPPSLQGEDLSGATLCGAALHQLDLRQARLCEVSLERSFLAFSDLAEADLYLARLQNADLHNAILARANLANAWAPGARLAEASLAAAHLKKTYLRLADLSGANVEQADMRGANLTGAVLRSTNLAGSNVEGAWFGHTAICDTDLTGVRGLEAVKHEGPSFIDMATFRRSPDIPHSFLRGCGMTDWEIEVARLYRRELDATAINAILTRVPELMPMEADSSFISYSHEDADFATAVYAWLQARGARCWLDEHQILPGERIHESIARAIRQHDRVLLCCSEASLTSSWVDDEIAAATERERAEHRDILIPLVLDRYLAERWTSGRAPRLRERLFADFQGWREQPQRFESQMELILRALRRRKQTPSVGCA